MGFRRVSFLPFLLLAGSLAVAACAESSTDGPDDELDSGTRTDAPVTSTPDGSTNTCTADTKNDRNNCGTCNHGCLTLESCVEGACVAQTLASCYAIHLASPAAPSGKYTIDPDGSGAVPAFPVYCDMTSDSGGWTLALKTDGTKNTFEYAAAAWTDDTTLNPDSTDLTATEAKFAAFSTMEFTALRLGMATGGQTNHLTIPIKAKTLSALFGGSMVVTTVPRADWLNLVSGSTLQPYCNRQGSNVNFASNAWVRLGIIGNDSDDCSTPDSLLGIGAGGPNCIGTSVRVGNKVCNYPPVEDAQGTRTNSGNVERTAPGFGYLYLR